MSEKLEGLVVTADTAVVELEELQGIIAEGQEKGFLASRALRAAVDEAELSSQQAQDLLSYLEEHGIEILDSAETAPELVADATQVQAIGAEAVDPLSAGAALVAEGPR